MGNNAPLALGELQDPPNHLGERNPFPVSGNRLR
jgi:hypothetical protein